MIKGEIQQNWQEIRKAKIKEINGLYEIGCLKRQLRHQSHNITDAKWAIPCKMLGSNVVSNADLQYVTSRTSSNI